MAHPNVFHSGNWRLNISNIPMMKSVDELKYFDNYYKTIILPDYNIYEYGAFGPSAEFETHPMTHKQDNLTPLQIDFKVSENFENYLYLAQWMLSIRYGNIDTTNDERLWRNVINRINVTLLDNQQRDVASLYFTSARVISLSSISLDSGVGDEVIFTVNFSYNEFGFEMINGELK